MTSSWPMQAFIDHVISAMSRLLTHLNVLFIQSEWKVKPLIIIWWKKKYPGPAWKIETIQSIDEEKHFLNNDLMKRRWTSIDFFDPLKIYNIMLLCIMKSGVRDKINIIFSHCAYLNEPLRLQIESIHGGNEMSNMYYENRPKTMSCARQFLLKTRYSYLELLHLLQLHLLRIINQWWLFWAIQFMKGEWRQIKVE